MSARDNKCAGFSLVEMVISMFLFTLLALSITMSLLFARYTAEDNILESTALTVATSLVEQIKGTSLDNLESPKKIDGKEVFEMIVGGEKSISLFYNEFNELDVPLVTESGGTTTKTFEVRVRPSIVTMTEGEGFWITVEYEYNHPRSGESRTRTIRNARSTVPTA